MTSVNLQELNNFIHNMYTDVGVNEKEGPGASIQQYLIDNLSNIGRYSHRDFERFGNYVSQEGDADHFDRQDGWVALTEEVPSIDHLTYGTGILYIHGEMEIPPYEDDPGDNIFGDEFYHVDKTGGTKHIYDDVVNPERFMDWETSSAELIATYLSHVQPDAASSMVMGVSMLDMCGSGKKRPTQEQSAMVGGCTRQSLMLSVVSLWKSSRQSMNPTPMKRLPQSITTRKSTMSITRGTTSLMWSSTLHDPQV